MATNPNGGRRVFSFSKPSPGPLLPAASANTLAVPNDASGHLNMVFTRDSAQKTRLPAAQAGPGLPNQEGDASTVNDNLQELVGLTGFVRPHGGISLRQAPVASPILSFPAATLKGPPSSVSNASNLLFPTSSVDTMIAARQDFVAQARPQQLVLPTGTGQKQIPQQQRKPLLPQNKATTTRGSTPAPGQGASQQHANSGHVDYELFEALMQSQLRKDKLLKEKEDLLNEANQELDSLHKKNSKLAVDLECMKEKSKAYIQQCDNLVRSAQNETKAYQESSREAYARCIEEVQTNLPELQSLKVELTNRMQNIQLQLEEEHQHRARIGPELLHALEKSKHTADFLRDKLEAAAIDLANANHRLEELDKASFAEKAALTQALKLLEDTRKDLAASRERNDNGRRLHSEQIETLLEENVRSAAAQISDLQQQNQILKEATEAKETELNELKIAFDNIKQKIDRLQGLNDELDKAKAVVIEKDWQLAVAVTEQQADKTRIKDLTELVKKGEEVKVRLEDALCRSAALEAQHSAHLANCSEQKTAVEQLERELTLARSQYTQSQLDLTQSRDRYSLLESGHEDLKATSHMAKQEYVDMQTKLEEARNYAKKQQALVRDELEKAAKERTRLENLLEQNIQKQSRDDLAALQAEKKALAVAAMNNVEKSELEAKLAEQERRASADRKQLEASITSLEKELRGSVSTVKELRSNIALQKVALDEKTQDMNILSSEKGKVAQELDTLRANYQELSGSFAKARAARDTERELHSQDKTRLEARIREADSSLATTKEELGKAQLQLQFLNNQAAEHTRLEEQRALQSNIANERWLKIENKMDRLTADLSDAKSSIHNAVEITSTLAAAQESNVDNSAMETLQSQLSGLQEELKVVTSRHMALEEMSRTILDRHQRGELTGQEATLVKLVAASAMQVHEKERVQGANDLRRREAMIQALQRRIMELEKQLAGRLERKSPNGQLVMMADILHSSPLSMVEEGGALMQQRILGTATTPAKHSPPNRSLPIDRFAATRAGLHNSVVPSHVMTFAKLNQASSEDAGDDDTIRQFSDKKVEDGSSTRNDSLPAMTRTMKRGRDEDISAPAGPSGGKSVGTRATRRRKVSAGGGTTASEDLSGNGGGHGLKKSGAGEGKVVGGGGEGNGIAAVAKYKAAQRGKLRR